MSTVDLKPQVESQPELNLLFPKTTLEQPLWKSLFQNLDEFFFPKKLPPLVLTSKPVPVKDIWGFYDYRKNGALGSTIAHVVVIAAIIGITLMERPARPAFGIKWRHRLPTFPDIRRPTYRSA